MKANQGAARWCPAAVAARIGGTMDTGYLSCIASSCIPAFYFGCIASAALHSTNQLVSAVSPFYFIGVILLFGLVAVRCLLARVVSTRTVFALGSVLLALVGAAYCLCGKLWVSSAVFYILLWGIGLKFCTESLLRYVGFFRARSASIFLALAALFVLGNVFGALLGYRIDHQIELQDLVFAGFLVGSVFEVLTKVCAVSGLSKAAGLFAGASPATSMEPPPPAADEIPIHCGSVSSQGFMEKYSDVCRLLTETFQLTKREGDVLFFVARGYKAAYCAHALGIAETTVRSHIRSIYSKTGTYSSDGLINMVESLLSVADQEADWGPPRWRPARPRR